jgi:hypothetical protein
MLSRLRMSVEDSITAFREISEQVTSSSRIFSFNGLLRSKYSTKQLERAVRRHVLAGVPSQVRGFGFFTSDPLLCKTLVEKLPRPESTLIISG